MSRQISSPVSGELIFSEKSKIPLFANNDSEIFGSLNRHVSEIEPDEGDIAAEEHYQNIPLRRDQLSHKRYADMIQHFSSLIK